MQESFELWYRCDVVGNFIDPRLLESSDSETGDLIDPAIFDSSDSDEDYNTPKSLDISSHPISINPMFLHEKSNDIFVIEPENVIGKIDISLQV